MNDETQIEWTDADPVTTLRMVKSNYTMRKEWKLRHAMNAGGAWEIER